MAYDGDELNKRREAHREEQRFLRAQKRLLRIGMVITAVTLVLCAAALLITQGMLRAHLSAGVTTAWSTPQQTTEAATVPTEPDTVIHFVAGGDVNVTDKTVAAGTTPSGYDYSDVFLDVAPILAAADLTAVNFEGSLYGAPYGTVNHSAPAELMRDLQDAGVDLVQTANSYSVANGLNGLQLTLQGIRSAGMEPVGAYADAAEFSESGGYLIRDIQGIRVAIVAFTKGMDGMGLPAGSEDCVNLLYQDYTSTYQKVDTAGIQAVLRGAEEWEPDVTIALLHWGSEFNDQISDTQEQIVKLMQKEGVDAIIGTHSHYVQKIAYDAEAGTLVAYSLGDLLGDADRSGAEYTVLLDLEITRDGVTGETKITGFDYTPVFLADETASGGGMRLLRIREAMAAYESNCITAVSRETYDAMASALKRIEARVTAE